jgi:phosphoglucomutase
LLNIVIGSIIAIMRRLSMVYIDSDTQIPVADPEIYPIREALEKISERFNQPLSKIISKQLESMILSVSGWRKIFAEDGDEESFSPRITPEDAIISGIIAAAFADYLIDSLPENHSLTILLGMDTRPTGPAIADSITRILLAKNIHVKHLFISAAPELMAYSAVDETIDGFIYITASHNPVGHNGLKFGRKGGVFDQKEASVLIAGFKDYCADEKFPEKLAELEQSVDPDNYLNILNQISRNKYVALDTYREFTIMTAASTQGICGQDQVLSKIRTYTEDKGLGIVAELNGSARTCSIDIPFMKELGIQVHAVHTQPGDISHRIIPEGFSLDECRFELEKAYKNDPSYLFGYVPDNDGDRGNIVYIDENTGSARALEAQEVFALAVLSELAFTEYSEESKNIIYKQAVVVNGPTSMRIDTIASAFGAEVFRCEVGEANTVNLAKKLRESGYSVRILGEGSNGGNITYPASVRDPLNTLMSFIKLMALRDGNGIDDGEGLFKIWCDRSMQSNAYSKNFTFPDILGTLPQYITTGTTEKRALLKIKGASQARLKNEYERLFLTRWEEDAGTVFSPLGIVSWHEVNTEGIESRKGMGNEFRTGLEKGGLKIIFSDSSGEETDFIWMRGSGTEPVFRVLADCKGADKEREKTLLQWHSNIVDEADRRLFDE